MKATEREEFHSAISVSGQATTRQAQPDTAVRISSKRIWEWQLRGRELFTDSESLNAKESISVLGGAGRNPDAAIDIFGHCANGA
jgi:hypothetical protein